MWFIWKNIFSCFCRMRAGCCPGARSRRNRMPELSRRMKHRATSAARNIPPFFSWFRHWFLIMGIRWNTTWTIPLQWISNWPWCWYILRDRQKTLLILCALTRFFDCSQDISYEEYLNCEDYKDSNVVTTTINGLEAVQWEKGMGSAAVVGIFIQKDDKIFYWN